MYYAPSHNPPPEISGGALIFVGCFFVLVAIVGYCDRYLRARAKKRKELDQWLEYAELALTRDISFNGEGAYVGGNRQVAKELLEDYCRKVCRTDHHKLVDGILQGSKPLPSMEHVIETCYPIEEPAWEEFLGSLENVEHASIQREDAANSYL
jgi:hypothetical protein